MQHEPEQHEPDLSYLIDPGESRETPPVERIAARARALRARRVRHLGALGVVVAVSAAGVGAGLGLSGAGSTPRAGNLPTTAMRERIPTGLSVVGQQSGSHVRTGRLSASGDSTLPSPSSSSSGACTVEGCIGGGLGTISLITPIPAPVVGNLVLSAEAYSRRQMPVAEAIGWKPYIGTVHGLGVCSTGPFLFVSVREKGSTSLLGDIVIPSAATTNHAFDVIGTAVLGTGSSGRVEIVATRTAPNVAHVSASWQDGANRSAVPVSGWAVLAVPYREGASPLVQVTATGASGARLDRAVVPADGALVTTVRTCRLPVITAPMNR